MRKCSLPRTRSESEVPRLQDLEHAVQAEIDDIRGHEELFLRSTSELTLMMKKLGRKQGRAYFRYVLRDVFGEKSRLYETRGPPSTEQVCVYAKSVIQRLAKALHFAPLVLRACCHYMLTEFRKAFPECKQDVRIVVGSLLFLRILCPALVKPELFEFPAHTSHSLLMGVQIAKLLQHTLSGTPVGDSNLDDSNAFINAFQSDVATFLVRFPQIHNGFGRKELQNRPGMHSSPSSLTPSRPTDAATWAHVQSWDAHRSNRNLRALSMSFSDVIKNKTKFSLRFWSRGTR